MPTLYVENVPGALYEALRRQAREHRTSVAAEVVSLLEQNVATPAELKRRKQFLERLQRMRSRKPEVQGPFPSTEQMQREDRAR